MIRTRVTEMLKIEHPIALGGMGSIYSPDLVAAVSNAGGLGAMGCHGLNPEQIRTGTAAIRAKTNKPFALNFLLFCLREDSFAAALELHPAAIAFAWPRPEQELKPFIDRAHGVGAKVTLMAGAVPEAKRAAQAGADIIIAQGTEGGGHVSWQASLPRLAAALALGADGALLGTRFLASVESPLHPNFKQAIVDTDGHDTLLSEIPDVCAGLVWPGAMSRSKRNRFIERWAGREWALRQNQAAALADVQAARKAGDIDNAPLSMGQDCGLIHDIAPAAEIVARIAREAEAILAEKLPRHLQ